MFVSFYFKHLKYRIKAVCKSLDKTNTILGCWRCFLYSNSYHRRILIHWKGKYWIAFHTLTGIENITCVTHCLVITASVKYNSLNGGNQNMGDQMCQSSSTLWNLCKVFHLVSLLKSVTFAFIHIQHVINLKKPRYLIPCFLPILCGIYSSTELLP